MNNIKALLLLMLEDIDKIRLNELACSELVAMGSIQHRPHHEISEIVQNTRTLNKHMWNELVLNAQAVCEGIGEHKIVNEAPVKYFNHLKLYPAPDRLIDEEMLASTDYSNHIEFPTVGALTEAFDNLQRKRA